MRSVAAVALIVMAGAFASCTLTTTPKAKATLTPNPPLTPYPTLTGSPTRTRTRSHTGSQSPSRTATNTPTYTSTPTGSRSPSRTATRTSTPTPTFTETVTPTPTYVAFNIIVDCWNTGGCTVCGNTLYSCLIGPVVNNCNFTDPCPGGRQVRRIVTTADGLSCTSPLTLTTSVDGTAIGTSGPAPNANCVCGACEYFAQDSGYYGGGFPGYAYGGTNTYTINVTAGTLCLSYVEVLVYCY